MRCLKARILYLLAYPQHKNNPASAGSLSQNLYSLSLEDRDLLSLLLLNLLKGDG